MPLGCAIVLITTMAVVIFTHNLAQGVLAGIAISAVMFAWKITAVKTRIHTVEYNENTYKIYRVSGQLFFASTSKFIEMFGYSDDPQEIIIDFKNSHVWDHSAVNAISKVKQKYMNLGKQVSIVGLNNESSLIVVKADEGILEY
jgi:SulP family sulfate permease